MEFQGLRFVWLELTMPSRKMPEVPFQNLPYSQPKRRKHLCGSGMVHGKRRLVGYGEAHTLAESSN